MFPPPSSPTMAATDAGFLFDPDQVSRRESQVADSRSSYCTLLVEGVTQVHLLCITNLSFIFHAYGEEELLRVWGPDHFPTLWTVSCSVCTSTRSQLTKLAEQKINVHVGSLRVGWALYVSGPFYFRYQNGMETLLYGIVGCLTANVRENHGARRFTYGGADYTRRSS